MKLQTDDGKLVDHDQVTTITFADEAGSSTATLLGADGEILGVLSASNRAEVWDRVILFMETVGSS